MRQTLSVAEVESRPETLAQIRNKTFSERFWPGDAQIHMESWQVGNATIAPLEFRAANSAAMRALMPSCVPAEFDAPGLIGAWLALMPLRRHARPIYSAQTPPEIRQKWLRLLNVRHYISLRPLNEAQLQPQSSAPLYFYRDEAALPRAFWVGSARIVPTQEAERAVSGRTFNAQREVILENDGGGVSDISSSGDLVAARISSYDETQIGLRATAPARAIRL